MIDIKNKIDTLTVGVRSNYPSRVLLLSAAPDIYLETIVDLSKHF